MARWRPLAAAPPPPLPARKKGDRMLLFILGLGFALCVLLWPAFRCALFHPVHSLYYAAKDTVNYFRHKEFNRCKTGDLDIYCGYFGSGKTLSLVHKVTDLYHQYDGKPVWDSARGEFVTQRILVLSNVTLTIPHEPLHSLAQIVAASKVNAAYDLDHHTQTVTIACVDELSVQLNSRSFKDNIDPTFLGTLLCCRHYRISLYGSAQRFSHVDKLMRDVTHHVIQCKKAWRLQQLSTYDAWELEQAASPELVRPLSRSCWFVHDKDYAAYDTLAVVSNLKKRWNEGDLLTEQEILANRQPAEPDFQRVQRPSRRGKKIKRA